MKESVTGGLDRVGAAVEPEGQKSYAQQAADSLRGAADTVSHKVSEYSESAKEALGMNQSSTAPTTQKTTTNTTRTEPY